MKYLLLISVAFTSLSCNISEESKELNAEIKIDKKADMDSLVELITNKYTSLTNSNIVYNGDTIMFRTFSTIETPLNFLQIKHKSNSHELFLNGRGILHGEDVFTKTKDTLAPFVPTNISTKNPTIPFFFKKYEATSSNCKVINEAKYENIPVTAFSYPYFNKLNDSAVIGSTYAYKNIQFSSIFFCKKINNKWKLMGDAGRVTKYVKEQNKRYHQWLCNNDRIPRI